MVAAHRESGNGARVCPLLDAVRLLDGGMTSETSSCVNAAVSFRCNRDHARARARIGVAKRHDDDHRLARPSAIRLSRITWARPPWSTMFIANAPVEQLEHRVRSPCPRRTRRRVDSHATKHLQRLRVIPVLMMVPCLT